MWFKVEVNKDGSVASCEQVDVSLKSGVSVVYIEAESKEKAIEKAVSYVSKVRAKARAHYERNRGGILATRRARRQARVDAGLCERCDRISVISGLCEVHRVQYNATKSAAEKKAKRQGVFVKKVPTKDPLLVAANIKENRQAHHRRNGRNERRKVRRSAFREALGFYDANPATFRSWLVARIVELDGAIAAAQNPDLPIAAE